MVVQWVGSRKVMIPEHVSWPEANPDPFRATLSCHRSDPCRSSEETMERRRKVIYILQRFREDAWRQVKAFRVHLRSWSALQYNQCSLFEGYFYSSTNSCSSLAIFTHSWIKPHHQLSNVFSLSTMPLSCLFLSLVKTRALIKQSTLKLTVKLTAPLVYLLHGNPSCQRRLSSSGRFDRQTSAIETPDAPEGFDVQQRDGA